MKLPNRKSREIFKILEKNSEQHRKEVPGLASYTLTKERSSLFNSISYEMLSWHISRHSFSKPNIPAAQDSVTAIEHLIIEILIPVTRALGTPIITYGFTSFALKSFIQKNSPSGTAPSLDQHSAYEVNSQGKQICNRGGAACDFYIEGVAASDVVRYIVMNLSYDRIYFYGNDRPVHVSFHLENLQHHLQIMGLSESGRRYPASKAYGEDAKRLAEAL